MLQILLYIIFGAIILNIIIFAHELGHYTTSRLLGVDVQKISIGFFIPIKFFTTKKNFINVSIKLLPIGGYCKLKGKLDLSRALKQNSSEFLDTSIGSIYSVKPISRFIIYISGPLFNLILTFLMLFTFYLLPYMDDASPAVIYKYTRDTNVKNIDEFMDNDLILSLDDINITTFNQAQEILKNRGESKKSVKAKVMRNGKEVTFTATPKPNKNGKYTFDVIRKETLKIKRIEHKSPEYYAGLREGDLIISINGIIVSTSLEFLNAEREKDFIDLIVKRDEEQIKISYLPKIENGEIINSFAFEKPVMLSGGRSIKESFLLSVNDIKNTIKYIGKLISEVFKKQRKLSQVIAGPAKSVQSVGEISAVGLSVSLGSAARSIIYISAILSLSLGLINLIPLPGLDGIGVLTSIVEMFKKKKTLMPSTYKILEFTGRIFTVFITLAVIISDFI